MTLSFMRNKVVEVEPLQENLISVKWRLLDDLIETEMKMKVRLPDLEIIKAEARMGRFPHLECLEAQRLIPKVLGVRVG